MTFVRVKFGAICIVMAMSPCNLAAVVSPYQLCVPAEKSPAQALSIDSNYRYSPVMVQRKVEAFVAGKRCDLPFDQAYWGGQCNWAHTTCGDLSGPVDGCCDGEGCWLGIDIPRGIHWKMPASDVSLVISTWPQNLNVQEHSGFSALNRVERHRIFYWNHPFAEQSEGEIDEPLATGEYPRCYTMAYLLGFFNGVWNTRREAERSLNEMQKPQFLGDNWRGAPVRYELFYNQSCKGSANDVCLQDLAETFRQRSAELDGLLERRWEYFWEQITGRHNKPNSLTQNLLGGLSTVDNAVGLWFAALHNVTMKKINALSVLLVNNPPTEEDTSAHVAQLLEAGQSAERAVLISHSQGNLFVNAAYDAYLKHSRELGIAAGEDTGYVAAKVVHVAPASLSLRGPHILADIDLVINGMRLIGGGYGPASNVDLPFDSNDLSGHKMVDTYLDEARPARAQMRAHIIEALDAL